MSKVPDIAIPRGSYQEPEGTFVPGFGTGQYREVCSGSCSFSSKTKCRERLDIGPTLLADESAAVVFGKRGSGKTAFLARLVKEELRRSALWQEGEERRAVQETNLRRLEDATEELNTNQRGWLAKSIRAWRFPSSPKITLVLGAGASLQPSAPLESAWQNIDVHHARNAVDLGHYLIAVEHSDLDGPNRSNRPREHGIPEWLREWLPEAIPVLVWGLDPLLVAAIVAPTEIPPTPWSMVSLCVRELAEMLARLAHIIVPNAPARSPRHKTRPFPVFPGGPALCS